jgi:hypothetical protein
MAPDAPRQPHANANNFIFFIRRTRQDSTYFSML